MPRKKLLAGILILAPIIIILTGIIILTILTPKDLKVSFLNVGQGDAILIRTPENKKILIDGGPDNSVIFELGKNLHFYERKIDYIILTHPDNDHVGGLPEVIKRFKPNKIIYTGVKSNTPAYLTLQNLVAQNNIAITTAIIPDAITSPQILLEEKYNNQKITLALLSPDQTMITEAQKEINDTSVVIKLTYGASDFIFTGDAGVAIEQHLLAQSTNLSAEVLKISHHGSTSASSEKFLQAVNPQYAIISVGQDNQFGHPHLRILSRLEHLKTTILRTDTDGQIDCEAKTSQIFCK